MDPNFRVTAKQISHRWLVDHDNWNYGRYNADLDSLYYPLLGFRYPDDKNSKGRTAYVKFEKWRVLREVLTEMLNGSDERLKQRAQHWLKNF